MSVESDDMIGIGHVGDGRQKGVVQLRGGNRAFDEDIDGFSKSAGEFLDEGFVGSSERIIGRNKIGGAELGLEPGHPESSQSGQHENQNESRDGEVFGHQSRLAHHLGDQSILRLFELAARQTAGPFGPAIEQSPSGRHEGQGYQERPDDSDGGQDAEIFERGDGVGDVGEEPNCGGRRSQNQGDPDCCRCTLGARFDLPTGSQFLAVAGRQVDAEVDSQSDQEHRQHLEQRTEVADDAEVFGAEEHPDSQDPYNRHSNGGQGQAQVGEGSAKRRTAVLPGLRADPVHRGQNHGDGGSGNDEQPEKLVGEWIDGQK